MNQRKKSGGTSVYKGAFLRRGKWCASITIRGRTLSLGGGFPDEIAAAKAYDEAAVELFGEFAHPNFPTRVLPVTQTGGSVSGDH